VLGWKQKAGIGVTFEKGSCRALLDCLPLSCGAELLCQSILVTEGSGFRSLRGFTEHVDISGGKWELGRLRTHGERRLHKVGRRTDLCYIFQFLMGLNTGPQTCVLGSKTRFLEEPNWVAAACSRDGRRVF
jgi:hypothetical protein